MTVESAVALLTVIGTLLAVFVSLFTAITSARKDAYTELKNLVVTLREENELLSGRVAKLENELKRKDREIDKRDEMIDDLKEWAEKLVNQVKSAGLEPVPFSRKRRDA